MNRGRGRKAAASDPERESSALESSLDRLGDARRNAIDGAILEHPWEAVMKLERGQRLNLGGAHGRPYSRRGGLH
jgi:hypothetical protein